MKTGIDLQSLAAELVRQAETKKDYVLNSTAMSLVPIPTAMDDALSNYNVQLRLQNNEPLDITTNMHRQVASKLNIPWKYYERMLKTDPELLALNVNNWLSDEPNRFMLRTLDGKARALLSDSYRTLDNTEVAQAVLPAIQAAGANIESCQVTESKLYIKAILPDRQHILKAPAQALDANGNILWGQGNHMVKVLKPGIVVSNSEVGLGALNFSPAILDDGCTNLTMMRSDGFRTVHVGGKAEGDADIWQYLKDSTKQLADAAVMNKLADLVEATLTGNLFDTIANKFADARQLALPAAKVETAIDELANKYTFSKEERDSVLAHLIQGGELNKYGMSAAITRASQDIDSYDRATDFERFGGQVIELETNEWQKLAA